MAVQNMETFLLQIGDALPQPFPNSLSSSLFASDFAWVAVPPPNRSSSGLPVGAPLAVAALNAADLG